LDYGIYCNFSPDGETVVYTNGGIRSIRLSDRTITQITSNSYDPDGNPTSIDWSPSYSPDGLKIVFNSWRPIDDSDTLVFRHWDIMLMDSDGSNLKTLVRERGQWLADPTFYPDGNRIVFTRHEGRGEYFISAMNLTDSTWHDIARAPTHSTKVSFNPEGTRIYFQSGYPAESIDLYWVSSSGGLYWKVFGNQVADTDPYVGSAWIRE
jgi:TolB protein